MSSYENNIIFPQDNSYTFKKVDRIPTVPGECYITWNDGSEYFGEYNNKHINGYGSYKFPDGSIYNGYWKQSCKHGIGILRYIDGKIYKGDFINDLPHGHGVLICDYTETGNDVYVGQFFNGVRSGYGKLYYQDNSTNKYELQYIGNWKNNKFSGLGICFHSNGNKFYEGHLVDGLPAGDGILYNEEGNKVETSYYITGLHQKDLDSKRSANLKKKIHKYIRFPFYYILE